MIEPDFEIKKLIIKKEKTRRLYCSGITYFSKSRRGLLQCLAETKSWGRKSYLCRTSVQLRHCSRYEQHFLAWLTEIILPVYFSRIRFIVICSLQSRWYMSSSQKYGDISNVEILLPNLVITPKLLLVQVDFILVVIFFCNQ